MPLGVIEALATLKNEARAIVRARYQDRGISDGNFLGKWALTLAMGLFGLHRRVEQIDNDSPPGPKSSTLGLDTWAFTIGLSSNAGGYGRNQPTQATGGVAPVTGTPGTPVNGSLTPGLGQQLTAPDGQTILQLINSGVIPFTGQFFAVTPGSVGNLATGTKLTWVSPPAGTDGSVVLSSPLAGALDQETNGDLLLRELARLQQPPKGGANIDYITWALEQIGVYRAFVYPRRGGTGTVDLVIVAAGSGAGRIPDPTVIAAVATFIESVQPTNVEGFSVYAPQQPADKNLTIHVRAELAPRYSWDWSDVGLALTVAGYNAGIPSLTLSAPAPATLTGAIDLGLKPRLQVVSASVGAPVIPEQPRVIAYDGTKTILTLESPMAVAPTNGDPVYAGAYAAPLVAQAILNLVDSLGPSRSSPYADIVNVWDDIVALYSIGTKATEAVDVDRVTKLLARVPALTSLGGPSIDIAVGVGAPAAVDYEPGDPGWPVAPEIAVASHVFVTQS